MVKISLIMPVYNSEKYVGDTIENILNQTFSDFELILVDDGSKDSSGTICDEYASKDNRIKVIHKENGGICDARNKGLEIAQGKYIMFSDNDDLMELNTLEENYKLAIENDADIVKFGRKALYIQDEKIYREDIRQFKFAIYNENELTENLINLVYDKVLVCIWDGIYKKEILTEFCTDFKKGGEDIDFNLKIFRNAKKLILNDKVYYHHYIRNGFSTSTKYDENKISVKTSLLKLFIEKCEDVSNFAPERFNLIQIRDYLNPVLIELNGKECKISNKEKKDCIAKIQFEFKKCKFGKMLGISKKYSIEYVLYKLKVYGILLSISKLKK